MKLLKQSTLFLLTFLLFALLIGGCSNQAKETSPASGQEKKSITVGTSPIFKDILAATKEEFDKDGYTLNVKIFDDLVTPNIALQEGSVDVNYYQHEPYLNQFNQNKGTTLVKYGNGTLKYFMGIFSKEVSKLADLKDGATVAIPNDPSNRVRALKVLQSNSLIKLKDDVASPTKLDITENKKNLQIVEMDIMKLVSSLDDVDAATINSIIAVQGGVDPKTALALEDNGESDKFAIIVAVKKGANNEKSAERLTKALQSDRVKNLLEEKYKGAIVPLF
ncbi:MetQ/NlpA family ABC transporter substrate-binding protein [Azotosporobacter soli]|uniref:MetQ/NlpA family ABC transporter substrate-binding protein n=1 Tax=Azotosporobacter soli TaxID=3055040 RepID=UPI0031FF2500